MTFIYNICQGAKFQEESKAICCGNGKYSLNPYPNLSAPIKELFNGDSADSEHFLKNIRRLNCAFQMTSFGCKEVQTMGGIPTLKFKVNSAILLVHCFPMIVKLQNSYKSTFLMTVIKLGQE